MRAFALFTAVATFSICAIACGNTPDDPIPFEPPTTDSADDTGSTKKSDKTSDTPSNTAAVVTPSTPATTPAPTTEASDTTWTGTLTTTDTVAFGGAPYCNYKTHFENVSVRITLAPDGSVKFADVNGNAVEQTVGTCAQKPLAENTHDYAFAPAMPSAGAEFEASGATANQPHAMMQATVTTASPGHVTLTWHRDDIGAPFDWTITADVPLTQDE